MARPCVFYPKIFPPGSIWERFPYLLPNLFSAVAVCCGVVIGILFLEETHLIKKKQRDRGLELGDKVLTRLANLRGKRSKSEKAEEQPLLESEEQLPCYRTTENSPQLVSTVGPEVLETLDLVLAGPVPPSPPPPPPPPPPSQPIKKPIDLSRKSPPRAFSKQVVLNIVSFGILA